MTVLRAGWRLSRVLAHLLAGAWIIRRRFGALDFEQRQALVQDWSRRLLGLLGLQLRLHGELPGRGPLLVLANHISWLDIIVINAAL
ncbi:MAG: 1-acyl-sn-glycerol-3-phosphate acyltransferase, partial [Pseudomonadota bacterium]